VLPSEFLANFFQHSTGSIYLCSLPNQRNGGRPAEICGRGDGSRIDELVLRQWDKPDRGAFFCINTLQPRQSRRSKETVYEIVCLHADLDLEKIDATPDEVLARLGQLPCLPSKVIHSGHGYHCYWILREPEQATPETIARAEGLLRALAGVLGGDPAVCEVARLMRLPGSFNTKNGDKLPVTIIVDRPIRYDLSDLEEWLEIQRPLIPGKGTAPPDNPFLAVAIPGASGASVDVDARLAAMRFKGSDNTCIHATQLAVTAALINRGASVEQVVRTVLESTQRAAGERGERWNWEREEKDIRAMCASWARKKPDGQQPPKHAITTVDDLMTKEFRPVDFLVPDLMPAEGVTLLVAKSKVGKSWMLYDICISAALGRELLGGRMPKRGHSLYLALEDSNRRLKFRAEKLLGFRTEPCPVSTATTWDRADAGGLEQIRGWVHDTRAAGNVVACVCVDVLEKFRPTRRERQPAYQQDYEAVEGLRQLATDLGLGIIVAHHQRKAGADDLQDTVLGTQGLTGVVDCVVVIERQVTGGFILDVRGRDLEAQQLAASFDKETCRWAVSGDAREMQRNATRRAIDEALESTPDGLTPQEIAAESGLKGSTVRMMLRRMGRDGEAVKAGSKYRRAGAASKAEDKS
jgi:hypothetical protein